MIIKIPIKFTDRNIDKIISDIYSEYSKNPDEYFTFDLTEVEFIGNQELLIFSGLLKSFVDAGTEFEILFFKKGLPTSKINDRVKKQIIQFWQVWEIYKVIKTDDYFKYFGIDGNSVERLQSELNYYPKLSELYSRHGVTPFTCLDYIKNYSEQEVQLLIDPIYNLNMVIEELLQVNNCHHPFTSNLLSTIITEEFYLNFLDHAQQSAFSRFKLAAFMSISFRSKIDENKVEAAKIQTRLEHNFETEQIEESKNFFFDETLKKYKNNSYIEFSFLDFGIGIPNSLKNEYSTSYDDNNKIVDDSEILKFAFKHDSSRHPIYDDKRFTKNIPRGLFDALTIVRRYKGLLIARSNYGKVICDFSFTNEMDKAFTTFGDSSLFFPGTLVSIYIPAFEGNFKVNESTIKPEIIFEKIRPSHRQYLNINSIASNLNSGKSKLYFTLLKELRAKITQSKERSLVFISFKASEWIESRIIKKSLYLLLTGNTNKFDPLSPISN